MKNSAEPMRIKENGVPIVVLVSSQHGGVGIIRSLGGQGIPVYGVHQSSREPAVWSRYLRNVSCWNFSRASNADSVLFLLDLAKGIGTRPILIATSDVTALFVAENAGFLEKYFLFATPSAGVVRTFSSKKQTADLCKELGIPSPETALPNSRRDAMRFTETTKFPVVVKGEHGEFLQRRGRCVRVAIAASGKELLDIYDLNAETGIPRLIFQEYIPGADDTIWMFNGYFNSNAECLFGATGRKLRQFPAHRGSTSLGICAKNQVVTAQTILLMRAVDYTGPVDRGYRYDARDGQYKLLDVNPRMGATFRLFVAQNQLDVARALYLDLTGQSVQPAEVPDERKWIVENNDLVSSWTHFREGQLNLGT